MMDANMRYIKRDKWFFASVGPAYKSKNLLPPGLHLCRMLDDTCKYPRVAFYIKGTKEPSVLTDTELRLTSAIYEGMPGGTGFICPKLKKQAKESLGGWWTCDNPLELYQKD